MTATAPPAAIRGSRSPRRRWRAEAALLGVLLAFAAWPVVEPHTSVLNSDWPSYATGGTLVMQQPDRLYDRPTQMRVESRIVSGARLVTREQGQYLSFDQGPWIALLAAGFVEAGNDLGGRLWMEFGLLALVVGMALVAATIRRGGGVGAIVTVPTGLMVINGQLDGPVVLGLGLACFLWERSRFAAALALTLCVAKPQLVLPVAGALVLARDLRVLLGWIVGVGSLAGLVAVVHPAWLLEWPRFVVHSAGMLGYELGLTGIVLRGSEPDFLRLPLTALALIAGLGLVLWLAWHRREDPYRAAAIVVAGGVLVSPHVLGADMVLLAFALLLAGGARAWHWIALSVLSLAAAMTHASPVSSAIGLGLVALVLWLLARSSEGVGTGRKCAELYSAGE